MKKDKKIIIDTQLIDDLIENAGDIVDELNTLKLPTVLIALAYSNMKTVSGKNINKLNKCSKETMLLMIDKLDTLIVKLEIMTVLMNDIIIKPNEGEKPNE